MVARKPVRTRGKVSLKKYFQNFEEGERVAFVYDRTLVTNVPKRFQGRTGVVSGKRGRNYIVQIKDQNKGKSFIIEPVHLKKLKTIQAQTSK